MSSESWEISVQVSYVMNQNRGHVSLLFTFGTGIDFGVVLFSFPPDVEALGLFPTLTLTFEGVFSLFIGERMSSWYSKRKLQDPTEMTL